VFNTDKGVPFTAEAFTGRLESAGVAVSMHGRGRAPDNAFVERLRRAVKYEEIYIQSYEEVPELRCGLARYFASYNHARLHRSLGYLTPAAVYATPLPRIGVYHGERALDNLDASRRGASPGPGDLLPGAVARTRFDGQGRVARRRACR
jgi:hypothetical protein